MKTFPVIDAWLDEKDNLPNLDLDDVTLFTGREGSGKSKLARKILKRLDPGFTVDRIHFEQEHFLSQAVTLQRGDAILLDEARFHKRESMRGQRMEFLDFAKECRGLGLHIGIVFNRFGALDKDLITDRVRDWCHIVKRGFFEVRQPKTRLVFDQYGIPTDATTYPLVAKFTFTDKENPEQERAYRSKKEARMRDRAARLRGDEDQPTPQAAAPKRFIDPRILEQVMAELRKP